MGENTAIEWATHTWSPWMGCTKVSAGCDHCYAETWAKMSGRPELWQGKRHRTSPAYWRNPYKWQSKACDLSYSRGTEARIRVFPSLCDPFDNQVPEEWRDDFWRLISETPNLDWLLLTKRPQNILKMLPKAKRSLAADPEPIPRPWSGGWSGAWPNVWLGTTVENQEAADRNIPPLLAVAAEVRFVSYEPALGAVNFTAIRCPNGCTPPEYCNRCDPDGGEPTGTFDALDCGIDWVIVGGESGSHARPMNPEWARSARDQCAAVGIPFFMKQMGGMRKPFPPIPDDLKIWEAP